MRLTKFLFGVVTFLTTVSSFAQEQTTKITKPIEPLLNIKVTTDRYIEGGHHTVTLTGTATLENYIEQSLSRIKDGMLLTDVRSSTTYRLENLDTSSSVTYTLVPVLGKFYSGTTTSTHAVYNLGNVGIGTTTPTVTLDVLGEARVFGGGLLIADNSAASSVISAAGTTTIDDLDWAVDSTNNYWYLNRLSDRSTSRGLGTEFIITDDGKVGIGIAAADIDAAATLDVGGPVYASGVALTSDVRYKTDVKTIRNALETLLKLRGVEHSWVKEIVNGRTMPSGKTLGVVAQELEQHLPELVSTDQNGYKSVDYTKITALLIEAIKDQQQLIEKQNSRMDAFEFRLQKLEEK